MTPNDEPVEPVKPIPPAEDTAEPDEPQEPPLDGVLTEEDVREIQASGLTLGDVIRALGLEEAE